MAAERRDSELTDHEKAKKKTKFGLMMSSMGRSAKQGMSRAGKQLHKGAVKAKQAAVEKIAKVPTSQEDPEIVSALERLKITKTEIYAISDIVRNLYDARVNEATFLIQLADKLKATKITQNDPFGVYVQKMGVGLSTLETVQTEHLKRMEDELVLPLEKFRDNDVESVQKLKLKYKNSKTGYDIAAHRLTKAQESNDQQKITTAQQKKDAAYAGLTQLRNDLKFQVNNLEQKKQVNLLGCMEQYWSSYSAFAAAQSNILSKNTIEKGSYVAPVAPAEEAYGNDVGYDVNHNNGSDEMKNNEDNGGYTVNNPNDGGGYVANDNNKISNGASFMDETPPPPDTNANGMPPPNNNYDDGHYDDNNNYDDGNYEEYEEYVEENDNGPTNDYNPFSE